MSVSELWRYPVKGMAGEAVEEVEVGWHGLAGDRRWAFVRPGLERSDFPWLTIRERSDLAGFVPRFVDPGRPDASATIVRAADGREYEVADPELAEVLAPGARVLKQNRGAFDAAPLSLISRESIAALERHAGIRLDRRRFRPNLLIEGSGPYEEDEWVGATVEIGEMRMRVDRRDPRCVVTNVDPDTHVRDPEVLRAIAREREACVGVYGTTVQPGRVRVGDAVRLVAG